MTKTARPTQNPITMESGDRKTKRKQDDQYFTCKKLPSTGSTSTNPKQFAAYFWVTKRRDNQIYHYLFLNRKLPLKISF